MFFVNLDVLYLMRAGMFTQMLKQTNFPVERTDFQSKNIVG